MIKIAVTGNIGSGKTTVCKVFESLGIPVYYADSEAKKFYLLEDVIKSVKTSFGKDVFDEHNQLKQAALASIVFNDPEKLNKLNNIIHPLVLKDFLLWADQHQGEKYVVYESALLFESGFYKHFDRSILVKAPGELALSRVMRRDKISEKEFNARASRQMSVGSKQNLADHLIMNDESNPLIPQVMKLHELFSSK